MKLSQTNLWTDLSDEQSESINGGGYCYYEKPKPKEYHCYKEEPKKEEPKKEEPKKEYCYTYKMYDYCAPKKSYC
jgi:hypothetical protein